MAKPSRRPRADAPPAPKRKTGRPPHVPSAQMRRDVSVLACVGTHHETIAELVGVSLATLKRYYQRELTSGKQIAVGRLAVSVFKRAAKSDSLAMFVLKTQGGWRENTPGASAMPTIIVQTVAPAGEPVAPPAPAVEPTPEPKP